MDVRGNKVLRRSLGARQYMSDLEVAPVVGTEQDFVVEFLCIAEPNDPLATPLLSNIERGELTHSGQDQM